MGIDGLGGLSGIATQGFTETLTVEPRDVTVGSKRCHGNICIFLMMSDNSDSSQPRLPKLANCCLRVVQARSRV